MPHYNDFPHIFDAVVAGATRQTQLALRLVCRAFKRAVDRHQVEFLTLVRHPTDAAAAAVSAGRGGGRIPGLPAIGPLSWSQLPEHPGLALTAHTRTLEVRGFVPPQCNLQLLRAAFRNVEILRNTRWSARQDSVLPEHTDYCPVDPKTLVDFVTQPAPRLDRFQYEPAGVSRALPPITKLVVRARGSRMDLKDAPASCREVVVMPPWGEERGADSARFEPSLAGNAIFEVQRPALKFTLVGLECTAAGTEAHFRTHLAAYLTGRLASRLGGLEQSAARAERILRQVELVSTPEYIRRVGTRATELEMIEYL